MANIVDPLDPAVAGNFKRLLVLVVTPDADIAAAPFQLQPVVLAALDVVTVNVGVGAREAAEAAVRPAAENVVAVVLLVRGKLVVAEDVVTRTLEKADGLRPLGMVSLAALAEFLTTVGIGPGVVYTCNRGSGFGLF